MDYSTLDNPDLIGATGRLDNPCDITAVISNLPRTGPKTYWALLDQIGSIENIWQRPLTTLTKLLPSAAANEVKQLLTHRESSPAWQQHLNTLCHLDKLGGSLITHHQKAYPDLLRSLGDAPPVLYIRGNFRCLNQPQLAIVGSRHCSHYGARNAHQFASYFAEAGFTITSGLAHGIDQHAHAGALSAAGSTTAVMGTGCDVIYPRAHRELYQDILETDGCIVSELPIGTKPFAGNFPRRNRIISGLSLGTLVVEAARDSGSLITAKLALEQNREVFAIPGSINSPTSRGCHELIKQGATLVETAKDIADQMAGWLNTHQAGPDRSELTLLPAEQQSIMDALAVEPLDLDALANITSLPTSELICNLTELELSGLIINGPEGYQRV